MCSGRVFLRSRASLARSACGSSFGITSRRVARQCQLATASTPRAAALTAPLAETTILHQVNIPNTSTSRRYPIPVYNQIYNVLKKGQIQIIKNHLKIVEESYKNTYIEHICM